MSDLSQLKKRSLPDYLEGRGYRRQPGSSRQSAVMKRESDTIITRQDGDGHWIYFSPHDPDDHGTVLDFITRRDGLSFHAAVCSLENNRLPTPTEQRPSPVAPAAFDPVGWHRSHFRPDHPYLVSRGIPDATLSDARFADTFRISSKGHALFPYRDLEGDITGLEIRGNPTVQGAPGLKVFSRGGRKTLWRSVNLHEAARIVVCESPIDCLSFHALHGGDAVDDAYPLGYVSFGGGLGNRQKALLSAVLCDAANRGADVILGTDNDAAGDAYATALAALSPVAVSRIVPVSKDWNSDLEYCNREQRA